MISQDANEWTVLIVDDEPDNLGVVQKILKLNGAEVHVATTGIEGLLVLNSVSPTFILLDLSMPEMDGWEMISKVRSLDKVSHVPVIALTAHAMIGDKQRVLQAGFDGYIAKPFRIESFMEEIRKCLAQSSNRAG